MHSTFIWQLNLPGSFVSKLPYKGKVFFEGPRTYRGVFEGGTVPKGKAGVGREALFGVQTSQGALGSHSTAAITAGRREMPYQASARGLLKSCICLCFTDNNSSVVPLPWRRRSSASLSAGSVEFTGEVTAALSARDGWHRSTGGASTPTSTLVTLGESPPCTSPYCPGESALQITACSLGAES